MIVVEVFFSYIATPVSTRDKKYILNYSKFLELHELNEISLTFQFMALLAYCCVYEPYSMVDWGW